METAAGRVRFAVSCSSNMNRSMEAHGFMANRGFRVASFGSGTQVKLPGPAADRPNCYEFGTPYGDIYNDLVAKDKRLYTSNGLLNMVDRNRHIKLAPQRFQDYKDEFDVVICLEERVYDQIVEDMHTRPCASGRLVHVLNVDIEDNHEEATLGALLVCELAAAMDACGELDDEIDEVLADFEAKHPQRNILHTVCFY